MHRPEVYEKHRKAKLKHRGENHWSADPNKKKQALIKNRQTRKKNKELQLDCFFVNIRKHGRAVECAGLLIQ